MKKFVNVLYIFVLVLLVSTQSFAVSYFDDIVTFKPYNSIFIMKTFLNKLGDFAIMVCNMIKESSDVAVHTDMLNKMEKILSEKEYSEDVKDIIRDIVETLYNKYDEYYEAYKILGVPDKKQYIYETVLNPLEENVDKIKVYYDNDDYSRVTFEGGTIGGEYDSENKEISLKYNDNYETMKERLTHEIYHATQYIKPFSGEYAFMWYVMGEGSAENAQNIMSNAFNSYGSIFVDDPNNDNCLINFYGRASDYSIYRNFYNKILILTNYDVVQQFQIDGNIDRLKESIQNKYGAEVTDKIFENMKNVINYYKMLKILQNYNTDSIHIGDEVVTEKEIKTIIITNAIELENAVLNCMKQDIEGLESKESVEQYFNLYNAYKKIYMIDYIQQTYIDGLLATNDYTDTVIGYRDVENYLGQRL